MSGKIYTEAEVAALLGRAARLQSAGEAPSREGLTLEEIKAAAADAGIDPRFVELASTKATDHGRSTWSIPSGVGRSLVVPGRLTDEGWEHLVGIFARELGGPGRAEVHETQRSWVRGPHRVTAEKTHGGVLLHAEADWSSEFELPTALMLVGAVAAGTTGTLALVSLEWTIGLAAALLAMLVAGGFADYRRRNAARQKQLREAFQETLDRCAAVLQESGASKATAHAGIHERAGRIERPSIDQSDGAVPEETSPQRRRIR